MLKPGEVTFLLSGAVQKDWRPKALLAELRLEGRPEG